MRVPSRLVAAFTLATLVSAGLPLRAAVSVERGLELETGEIVETSQRELHAVTTPGRPTRRIGRLPKGASPPYPDGKVAWSVTTGNQDPRRVRLFLISPSAERILRLEPSSAGLEGPVEIRGIAGADPRFVYLQGDLRFRKQDRKLERGHLDIAPELEVLETTNRGEETWYLARDRRFSGREHPRLWLLYSRNGGPPWSRTEAGEAVGRTRLASDEGSVYLIRESGGILRFEKRSLRLTEDLTPMLHPGRVGFFSADASHYWVQTGCLEDGSGGTLWKIDRAVLDGSPVRLAAIPDGFAPVADDGERIWFASLRERSRRPLLSARKSDGVIQSYAILGRHARHWRQFGRGLAQGTVITMEGVAVIALLPALLFLGIFSLAAE